MKPHPTILSLALLAAFAAGASAQEDEVLYRTANRIRKSIVTLNNYGVFDWVTFTMEPGSTGYKVTLKGYASRPTLKDSAEKVTRKIEQVGEVVNQIEVLPTSRMDEDIRARVYVAIYFNPTLARYNPGRGAPIYAGLGARQAAIFGISNDPPLGYHPIAIIVKNGNVILEGVVDNEMDKNVANVQANTVPGVFNVTNNLQVLKPSKKKR
jgi:hypothetical protein